MIVKITSIIALLALTGCAGTVQKPYIYSSHEPKSVVKGATGEQSYCAHGLPQLVQDRKKQAYANIAEACGGDDKYAILDELSGNAHTVALGVEAGCAGFAGRVIYFKCKGVKPTPTGYNK